MNKIEIRVAKPDDVKFIKQVQYDTWIATYPNEKLGITVEQIKERLNKNNSSEKIKDFAESLSKDNQCTWLAIDNKNVIGYCTASKSENIHKLAAIYVHPNYHGEKVGDILMERAIEWLGTSNNIEVEVASYNARAISFYKRYGFLEDGRSGDSGGIPTIFLTSYNSN